MNNTKQQGETMKALLILNKMYDDLYSEWNEQLDEAIKELEELQNRSCDRCKSYLSDIGECDKGVQECVNGGVTEKFYCSEFEPKEQ